MKEIEGKKIGIIGGGNMGEALARGIIEKQVVSRENLLVSDKRSERLDYLKKNLGVKSVVDNISLVGDSPIIILAIKPQEMDSLLKEISFVLDNSKLVISIAAVITTSFIEERIGGGIPLVRVMPNLCALSGEGVSAYCLGKSASPEDEEIAQQILRSVGQVTKVKEELMDAVTGLSGSGPAYICYFLEAMIEAGEKLGLGESSSKTLSLQTLLGTAKMLAEGQEPSQLRERVTSPGGTTQAAIKVLEDKKWKQIFIEAIERAAARSKELREGK